jgi:cyclohexa-1,5-dienecarbonyl-CoA hydratase
MSTDIGAAVEDGVGRLTLDHPPLNILTRGVLRDLRESIAALEREPDVRAILLSAEGKHFSAGADVEEHLPPEHEVLIPEFLDTVRAIRGADVPVIAAVQGRCLGAGFELVLAADVIVAADGTLMGQPEIQLGVLPPAACALLPGRCAWGTAIEIVLGGDPVTAEDAYRAGLVQRVVSTEALLDTGLGLARRLARHSGAVIRLGKKAMLEGSNGGPVWGLERAADIYLDELMDTEDALEGLQAFVEKRSPVWRHR